MACRSCIAVFVITATLLQLGCLGAAARHGFAIEAPGSNVPCIHLRGKMNPAEEECCGLAPSQVGVVLQEGRRLWEEGSVEADDSVQVEDYTPPCANNKDDPSACKHN